MTDIAQILGVHEGRAVPAPAAPPPPPPPSSQVNRAAQKVQKAALSREVMHLLSAGDYHTPAGGGRTGGGGGVGLATAGMGLPTAVPTFKSEILGDGGGGNDPTQVKVGTKWIRTDKPARKWAWAPFTSSSRTDGALFYHWVRAGVEYPDYPYSRFDIHLDPVIYTDEEYKRHLTSDDWTRGETDALMELARILELRWAVIHDRWIEQQPGPPRRNVEDLQHRYYSVAAKIGQIRITTEAAQEVQALVAATPTTLSAADDASKIIATENLLVEAAAARALASADGSTQPLIANLGTGSTNKVFDLDAERERRAHLNALWNRSKEDEAEEFEIRKELKQVEAQLRKLKKSGVHIMAAATAAAAAAGGASTAAGVAAGIAPANIPPFAAGAASAASAATSAVPSAASSRNPSRAVSPTTAATLIDTATSAVDHAMNTTAPIPTARTPYLQSGRLVPPNAGGGVVVAGALSGSAGINKALLARMDAVLAELKVDVAGLVPTKRVCDLYDTVRRDILTLLILQKNLFQKEAMLESKRLKLSKMGGSLTGSSSTVAVLDEEALMGIKPPQQPTPTAAAAAASATGGSPSRGGATGGAAAGATGKSKGGSGGKQPKSATGGGKAKSAGSKPKAGGGTADEAVAAAAAAPGAKKGKELKDDGSGKPKKPAVKRKRNKSDASTATGGAAKMPPPSAGTGTAEASTETSTAVPVPSSSSAAAASSTIATPVAPPSSGAAAAAAARRSDDGKPAKKRAKKAAPPAAS